jgi:hypothetical protein
MDDFALKGAVLFIMAPCHAGKTIFSKSIAVDFKQSNVSLTFFYVSNILIRVKNYLILKLFLHNAV